VLSPTLEEFQRVRQTERDNLRCEWPALYEALQTELMQALNPPQPSPGAAVSDAVRWLQQQAEYRLNRARNHQAPKEPVQ
jgi:hypothetical protein